MKTDKLIEFARSGKNIAKDLDGDELAKIGEKVRRGFDTDWDSLEGWRKTNKEAIKLAMQIEEMKSSPWTGASNVKYPLVTMGCIQFSSRVLPNIIKGADIVKVKKVGPDPTGEKIRRAERIRGHMNYQLTEQMDGWEEGQDKLMTSLPALGCMFKKTHFNSVSKTNQSDMIMPMDLVVNYYAKSFEPRATHRYELHPNEVEERVRAGRFLETELGTSSEALDEEDNRQGTDDDAPHVFLEQHRWLDLDDDGYQEPYIVTIVKQTSKVVRITARFEPEEVKRAENGDVLSIKPQSYFTKFPFIPAFDGSFYDIGFGWLVGPMNKTVNQAINQMLDAGTLSNMQAGFMAAGVQFGRGKGGGIVQFKPGEWKSVQMTVDDIRKAILPLPATEPSMVLFSLLGMMVEAAERVTSVTDVLTGESPGSEVPATTTLALIEQGLKVFGAIYTRIHRSLKEEYKKLFRLNQIYLKDNDYFMVHDQEGIVARRDYELKDCNVLPVSDTTEVTDTQRLIKAQALMSMKGQGLNDDEINRRWLEAMNIDDVASILEPPPEPPPPPELLMAQAQIELEKIKFEFEMMKGRFEIMEMQSKAIKNLAQAEAAEEGPQIERYTAQLKSLDEQFKATTAAQTAVAKGGPSGQGASQQ